MYFGGDAARYAQCGAGRWPPARLHMGTRKCIAAAILWHPVPVSQATLFAPSSSARTRGELFCCDDNQL